MSLFADTWWLYLRQLRNLMRQPVWLVIMLIQPLFWLFLFSQLFRRVVDLPGFGSDSYVQFLTPGLVIMTTFFSALWSGMAILNDIERGVVERLLVSPARRPAVVMASAAMSATSALVQALIILSLGYAMGARVAEGLVGWIVILVTAALVSCCFAGLSNGIALLARREETMIAVANFIGLPLMFISSTLIVRDLMPAWMSWAARFNPVEWGVQSARQAMLGATDWLHVAGWLGLLLAATVLSTGFATWAFGAYRRTL